MTLRNFHIPDELWQKFLDAIGDEYDSYSQALRALIKKHIKEKEAK